MLRAILVTLTFCFFTCAASSHAGIILGFEPVWEDGATLVSLTSGGSFRDAVTDMEFVAVKGGCFKIGDTFGDGQSDEKPVHEVCVSDFRMGKYEVTQGEWLKIMGNNPSYFKEYGETCPVEQVSWDDAQEFIGKLNSKSGKKYRLPTEAEWEYAARSGGRAEKYSGGNDVDAVAWYGSNSGSKTRPVGRKQANGLGIHDMSGNVWEWVNDWYGDDYYGKSSRNNPQGPITGFYRVNRGDSWGSGSAGVRASRRGVYVPGLRDFFLGFRLVAPVQ